MHAGCGVPYCTLQMIVHVHEMCCVERMKEHGRVSGGKDA
jgi:hypothetical protein